MLIIDNTFSRLVIYFLFGSALLQSCTPPVPGLPLFEAVEQEEIEIAKQLLASDVNPNIADAHGVTPLHNAVMTNTPALVKMLLANHANPNIANKDGCTPLAYAAQQGYLEIGKLLLVNHAHPDGIVGNAETLICSPLHLAIDNGHLPIVELLINNNANVYMPDSYGNLPMQLAIEQPKKSIALVRLLLAHHVSPNMPDNSYRTALHIAADIGHLAIVKILLASGADPTRTDAAGYTPLHCAAMGGHAQIAELLIDHYVAPWGDASSSSLYWAVAKASVLAVEQLLAAGFDPDETDYGFTPLLIATTLDRLEIGKMLLAKGANPNATSSGLSPLEVAITHNHFNFLKLLLAAGASLNIVDQHDYNALHIATKYGRKEMTSLLLAQGGPPNNFFSLEDNTVLYTAAYYGQLDLAKFWVDQGMKLDSNQGNSANCLGAAAYNGHLDVVKFFLEQGANVHTCDQHGYTPLHLAAVYGYTDIINLLLQNGADVNAQTHDGNTFLHMLAVKPALFSKSIHAIEATNRTIINHLQETLRGLFPMLACNTNEDMLAVILDYAQGIGWELKNAEQETIIDILRKKELVTKQSGRFEDIFKMIQRHQRLGGWYQTPAYTNAPSRSYRRVPEQTIGQHYKEERVA